MIFPPFYHCLTYLIVVSSGRHSSRSVLSTTLLSSLSNFNPVFPRVRKWPDVPYSLSNRSHSLSPSRTICSHLHSQPNLLQTLFDLSLNSRSALAVLAFVVLSLEASLPPSKCFPHPFYPHVHAILLHSLVPFYLKFPSSPAFSSDHQL